MANNVPPSKPNPLHGKPALDPPREFPMPGAGPSSDMKPPDEEVNVAGLSDGTKAEMGAGKLALATHGDQLKAEQEAGKRALAHHR